MIILPGPDVPQFSDTIVSVEDLLFGLEIDGVAWIFDTLKGWTQGGAVETNFSARPGRHGLMDAPGYRRGRVIELGGACLAESGALAEAASDALAALLADGSMGTLTVQNSRRLLSAKVRLSDEPLDDWLGDDTAFRWSLQFTAPDNRRYGETVSASTPLPGSGGSGLSWPIGSFFDFGTPPKNGSVTFTNNGTAPTEPELRIVGPLTQGFQAVHVETGRRLRYEGAVGTDELIIDSLEGTATSGGQDRTGLLTADDFFTVDPGATATFQWSSLGPETASDPARMFVSAAPAFY